MTAGYAQFCPLVDIPWPVLSHQQGGEQGKQLQGFLSLWASEHHQPS